MDLVRGVEELEKRVVDEGVLIVERDALIGAQLEVIVQLRGELEVLRGRGDADSGNSSLPPSRDGVDRRERRAKERDARKARARQAREAGESGTDPARDRRPGKRPGAPGSTLMRRTPDRTLDHVPVSCRRCHGELGAAPVVGEVRRQVLEIPAPRLDVTDHVAQRRRCGCGCVTTAAFPAEASGPVVWGPRARAIAQYLAAGPHLPYERCAEAMATLFGAPIGQGTLATIMLRGEARLASGGFLERLKALLANEPVVCADETSIRVGTSSSWIHTISTESLTFLALDGHRGIDAINAIGVLPAYRGVIMHDGLATYHREELARAGHAQ